MKRLLLVSGVFFAQSLLSAVLVEDKGVSVSRSEYSPRASSGMDLRRTHRAAFGMSAGGALGMAGVNIELNFNTKNSLNVGFGGGPGYSSFAFQWKRVISGKTMLPYVQLGYARIFSSDETSQVDDIQPDFLVKKLMTSSQISAEEFAIDMLTPSLGVQYLQLDGSWVGLALGLELSVLYSIQRSAAVPTGGLSALYYF